MSPVVKIFTFFSSWLKVSAVGVGEKMWDIQPVSATNKLVLIKQVFGLYLYEKRLK